jgi:hypothetical protein
MCKVYGWPGAHLEALTRDRIGPEGAEDESTMRAIRAYLERRRVERLLLALVVAGRRSP